MCISPSFSFANCSRASLLIAERTLLVQQTAEVQACALRSQDSGLGLAIFTALNIGFRHGTQRKAYQEFGLQNPQAGLHVRPS